MVAVSRYATMRRFLSKLKELLRVESSYLMVKPLKQWPYHPHIGRKSGTDLARPSIVPCILHKAERERSINRRHVYTKQGDLSIAGMYIQSRQQVCTHSSPFSASSVHRQPGPATHARESPKSTQALLQQQVNSASVKTYGSPTSTAFSKIVHINAVQPRVIASFPIKMRYNRYIFQ